MLCGGGVVSVGLVGVVGVVNGVTWFVCMLSHLLLLMPALMMVAML